MIQAHQLIRRQCQGSIGLPRSVAEFHLVGPRRERFHNGTDLTAPERVDFMGNAQSLTNSGKLPAGDALKLVEIFHSDPERHVVQNALDLALRPRVQLVPESLEANYQRFLLKNFQARAHELGWAPNDWDRLSAGTVAGHLIECGAQATGGLWCNWQEAVDPAAVGYPVA